MKSNIYESKFFMKLHYFYCCTLAVVLGDTVLAAGRSSTGTGFNARIISPIAAKQQASSSEEYGSHQPLEVLHVAISLAFVHVRKASCKSGGRESSEFL